MDTEAIPRRFDFVRDSFAFANELIWEYRREGTTGGMSFLPREPKPDYAHRCFVLTRAARLFLYHARFDAVRGVAGENTYRQLVREVLSRNPRKPSAGGREVVFPGYASLREFSRARESLLKAECGGAWRSYVLRSHWRMVFPISRAHQRRTSAGLLAALRRGLSPIVHLVRFPSLTINHGMILFDAAATSRGVEYSAYDPNDPSQPVRLTFAAAGGAFALPPNRYWPGGELDVIEIYRSWLM